MSATTDPNGYYAILGVLPTADAGEIRRAFRAQSTTFHPDKNTQAEADVQQVMQEQFQRLNEAYQVLSDPYRRAAYDTLGRERGVDRLAMLKLNAEGAPEGTHGVKPEDVARALRFMERESELRTTAKLLGASSETVIQFNMVQYFAVLRQAADTFRVVLASQLAKDAAEAAAVQRETLAAAQHHEPHPVDGQPSLPAEWAKKSVEAGAGGDARGPVEEATPVKDVAPHSAPAPEQQQETNQPQPAPERHVNAVAADAAQQQPQQQQQQQELVPEKKPEVAMGAMSAGVFEVDFAGGVKGLVLLPTAPLFQQNLRAQLGGRPIPSISAPHIPPPAEMMSPEVQQQQPTQEGQQQQQLRTRLQQLQLAQAQQQMMMQQQQQSQTVGAFEWLWPANAVPLIGIITKLLPPGPRSMKVRHTFHQTIGTRTSASLTFHAALKPKGVTGGFSIDGSTASAQNPGITTILWNLATNLNPRTTEFAVGILRRLNAVSSLRCLVTLFSCSANIMAGRIIPLPQLRVEHIHQLAKGMTLVNTMQLSSLANGMGVYAVTLINEESGSVTRFQVARNLIVAGYEFKEHPVRLYMPVVGKDTWWLRWATQRWPFRLVFGEDPKKASAASAARKENKVNPIVDIIGAANDATEIRPVPSSVTADNGGGVAAGGRRGGAVAVDEEGDKGALETLRRQLRRAWIGSLVTVGNCVQTTLDVATTAAVRATGITTFSARRAYVTSTVQLMGTSGTVSLQLWIPFGMRHLSALEAVASGQQQQQGAAAAAAGRRGRRGRRANTASAGRSGEADDAAEAERRRKEAQDEEESSAPSSEDDVPDVLCPSDFSDAEPDGPSSPAGEQMDAQSEPQGEEGSRPSYASASDATAGGGAGDAAGAERRAQERAQEAEYPFPGDRAKRRAVLRPGPVEQRFGFAVDVMWPPRNFIAALLPSEIAQAAGLAPAAPGLTITTFSFLYRRGEHRVSLPFIVSAAPSINTAARSLVLPVLLYRTFTLIADRLIEKRRRVDLVRRRVTAEPWLRREQQRATLEQRGMQDAVRARAAQENRIGGLVITNATYGVLRPRLRYPDFETTTPSSPAAGAPTATGAAALRPTSLTFDVTVAVQNLVRESRLHLPEGTSKVELAGFYDPHPYAKSSSSSSGDVKDRSRCVERKQLRIQYRFNGRRHEAVFDDLDSVTLPLPQHVLRSQMR